MIPVEKFDDRNWLWLKLFIGRGGAGANRGWATGPLKNMQTFCQQKYGRDAGFRVIWVAKYTRRPMARRTRFQRPSFLGRVTRVV